MPPYHCSDEKPNGASLSLTDSLDATPYRRLQTLAVDLKLPGNLKGTLLKELIAAKLNGKHEFVDQFIQKHDEEKRIKRESKLKSGDSPGGRSAPKKKTKGSGSVSQVGLIPLDLRKVIAPPEPDPKKQQDQHQHSHQHSNQHLNWHQRGQGEGRTPKTFTETSLNYHNNLSNFNVNHYNSNSVDSYDCSSTRTESPSTVSCSSGSGVHAHAQTQAKPLSSWDDLQLHPPPPKQKKVSSMYADNPSFAYPPNLLPLRNPLTDFRSLLFQDFGYSSRDWQPQGTVTSALQGAPSSISSHTLPTFEANTTYGPQYYSSVYNMSSNCHASSVSYSSYNTVLPPYPNQMAGHLPPPPVYDSYPAHSYGSTASIHPPPAYNPYSSMYSDYFNPANYDSRLPSKTPFAETTSHVLPNLDLILPNDIPSSASVDGGGSLTSSLENNVSWTSFSQEMLSFLNSDLSCTPPSPETSLKKLESEEVDLLGFFPEFQCSTNQLLQPSGEALANNQIQKNDAVSNDCQLSRVQNSCHNCCVSSLQKPVLLNISNNTNPVSQVGAVVEDDPLDKTLLDQEEADATLCIPSNCSQETDDLDLMSEGDLVINEDIEIENAVLSGMQGDCPELLSPKNGADQLYEALDLQTSSSLISLNSHDVESVIKATESCQEPLVPDYDNLPINLSGENRGENNDLVKTTESNLAEEIQPEEIHDETFHGPHEENSLSSLISVGQVKPYMPDESCRLKCPLALCEGPWDLSVQSLDEHLRECHSSHIVSNEKYLLPCECAVASLAEKPAKVFIMEAEEMLLIVSIFLYNGKIISTLQYASKSINTCIETELCLNGALEVLDANHAGVGWSGKVNPYPTNPEDLISSNQCLILYPKDFGASISVYAQVFFPPVVKQQPQVPEKFSTRKRSQRGCKRKLILDL